MIDRRDFFKLGFAGALSLGALKSNAFSLFGKAPAFGSKGHAIGAKSDAMEIIRYWKNVPESDIAIFEHILKFFEKDTKATYAELLADKTYNDLIAKYSKKLLGEPMLANLRKDTLSLWLRTIKPQKVQVEYSCSAETFITKEQISCFENDLALIFDLENLEEGKRYTYSLIIDGEKLSNDAFYFDFMPTAEKVRIAFGTCPHRWGLGNAKLFDTIKRRKPNAMLLYGDIAVQDRRNRLSLHRADYLLRDFQTAWRSFVCNVPVYASWDDHDYFTNDHAGIPKGFTDEDRRGVRKIFINSWANPYYGNGKEGIYTSFSIGNCDVIMTDNRYFREGEDPKKLEKELRKLEKEAKEKAKQKEKESKKKDSKNKDSKKDDSKSKKEDLKIEENLEALASVNLAQAKTEFLGKMQMQWLKDSLLGAKGKFIILSCGTMWSDFVSNGKDSWGIFDPSGREEIFSFIEENGIKGVLLISGDRHGARIFAIERKNGFKFYEFEVASLGCRAGPDATNSSWKTQLFGIDSVFAFGEFNFDSKNGSESVEMNLIDENEKILFSRKFSLSEISPKVSYKNSF